MDKKVLRWNFVFQYGYVITNIINSLLLLPVYLHHINAVILGVWLATGNILSWMTLIDPGIGEVLQQKIAELYGKDKKKEIGLTIGSGLMASSLILPLAVVAGFIFYSLIGVIINKDVSQYPHLQAALFISIIATGMSLTSFSMSGINQGLQNASQVAISSIVANVLFLAVNLTLLTLDFGIISIAFANLCRALFVNIYNIIAIKVVMHRLEMKIIFEAGHFKWFVRIFSFTSLASIIGGLSASMDTIFLARFISPAMITMFEINKRPIQLSGSMIGRHSVALMPSVSHALGREDKTGIMQLVTMQFKYYAYATLFIGLILCFNYHDLITVWTGKNEYAGDLIIRLLVANFFFGLIGYFMSNIGYALGDIKINSLIYILKGFIIGVLFYFGAKFEGITGVVMIMLAGSILIDFLLFSYRLYRIGYLTKLFIQQMIWLWALVLPLSLAAAVLVSYLVNHYIPGTLYILRIFTGGALFTLLFGMIVIAGDAGVRSKLSRLKIRNN